MANVGEASFKYGINISSHLVVSAIVSVPPLTGLPAAALLLEPLLLFEDVELPHPVSTIATDTATAIVESVVFLILLNEFAPLST